MKRIGIVLLCFLLGLTGAQAESTGAKMPWAQCPAWQTELTCDMETLAPLTGDALTAACEGLSRLRLLLTAGESMARIQVLAGDETLFDADFSPLSGLPPLNRLPGAYPAMAGAAFPVLEGIAEGKAVRKSTAVRNAAASASRVEYVFPADETNAVWPQVIAAVRPVAQAVFGADEALWAEAAALRFTGDLSVKRLLDADGQDMGIQANVLCGVGDDERKVTLQYGFTPGKGGYLSLSAPAARGKNTCKVVCNIKLTAKNGKNTCTLDGSFTRRLGAEAASAEWEGKLQRAEKNGIEEWTGSLMASVNAGEKAVYTLRPKLTCDENGLRGDVTVQKKKGKTLTLAGTVHLALTGTDAHVPSPDTGAASTDGLSRALVNWLASLSPETRAQITYQLRGEDWLSREESVPPPEDMPDGAADKNASEINEWTVKEE